MLTRLKLSFKKIKLPLALLGLLAFSVHAHPPIHVKDGYARATFPMAESAALYFTLHNKSDTSVTLTHVSVDQKIAQDAQIHTTEMKNDMMRMHEMKEGIKVPPQESVSFEPGGYHVMLLGLKQGLSEGNSVPLSLYFENGEVLNITLPVQKNGENVHHHHH